MTGALGLTPPPEDASSQQVQAAVAGVWAPFKDVISGRVTVLERATTALLAGALGDERRKQAEHEAHKLAGSLGTFGFPEGSRMAREIERTLQAGGRLGQHEARHLSELVVALRRELEQAQAEPPAVRQEPWDEHPLLLIVDDDEELDERLTMEAMAHGLRIEVATNLASARRFVARTRSDVVLLDLSLGDEEDGLTFLAELSAADPPFPPWF